MQELEDFTARVGLVEVSDFAFGPGGLLLVASSQGAVKLLDLAKQEEVGFWVAGRGPLRVDWAGPLPISWLASGTDVRIWRLGPTGEVTTHDDVGQVVVPVGAGLVIGSVLGQHVYLEPSRRSWLRELEAGPPLRSAAPGNLSASHDGGLLIRSNDGLHYKEPDESRWHHLQVDSELACVSPDGATIAIATPSGIEFLAVSPDVLRGGTLNARRAPIWDEQTASISFSPNSRSVVAFAKKDGDVRIVDVDGTVGLWTTSAIPPRFALNGRLVIVPRARDRLQSIAPTRSFPRTWFEQYGRKPPARMQIPSRVGMRRGDNLVVLSRAEPKRPLGVYRTISGPRRDDPPSVAETPASYECELALSFPAVPDDVVPNRIRPILAKLSNADEDSTHDNGHRDILEAISEIYGGDGTVIERAFALLGPAQPIERREGGSTSSQRRTEPIGRSDQSPFSELQRLELIAAAGERYASFVSHVDFAMVATTSPARILSARATLTHRETSSVDLIGNGWLAVRRAMPLSEYERLADAAHGGRIDFEGTSYSFPTPLEIAHHPFRTVNRTPGDVRLPRVETVSCADPIASALAEERFTEWKRRISAETDVFDVDDLRERLSLSQTFMGTQDRRQFSLELELPLMVTINRVNRDGINLSFVIDVPVHILDARLKIRNDNTQEAHDVALGIADRSFDFTWPSRTPASAERCLFSYKVVRDDDVILEGRVDVLAPVAVPNPSPVLGRGPLPMTRVLPLELPRPTGELIGAKVGQWRLTALIGVGGYGAIYRGQNETTLRQMAVKVVNVSDDRDVVIARWKREVRVANEVDHPGLVSFLDADFDPALNVVYATMEVLVGEDLRARIGRGRLSEDEAIGAVVALLDCLAACHERGIVHRDLHPGNLFLETLASDSVRVRLLDFGLCSVAGRPRVTRSTTGVGHVLYASPEQLTGGADSASAQADVWSVGVILYELLTGKHPFESDTDAGTVILAAREPHVPAVERGVDKDISALIDECLQKSPDLRPADARAVLDRLQAITRVNLAEL
jgi:hypothetical protein